MHHRLSPLDTPSIISICRAARLGCCRLTCDCSRVSQQRIGASCVLLPDCLGRGLEVYCLFSCWFVPGGLSNRVLKFELVSQRSSLLGLFDTATISPSTRFPLPPACFIDRAAFRVSSLFIFSTACRVFSSSPLFLPLSLHFYPSILVWWLLLASFYISLVYSCIPHSEACYD